MRHLGVAVLAAALGVLGAARAQIPAEEVGERLGIGQQPGEGRRGEYEVQGTLEAVQGNRVLISREGRPSIVLRVEEGTPVTLDGRPVSLGQLQEGTEIRASFDVQGERNVAARVEAGKGTEQPERKFHGHTGSDIEKYHGTQPQR